MRALKLLVVVLGVLLVGGTTALVVAVMKRAEERRANEAPPVAAARAAPAHLSLPAGARIIATELADDRLLVRAALADGDEELFLFDARTGALVATVEAATKP